MPTPTQTTAQEANYYFRTAIPWFGLPPETFTGTEFWRHSEARSHLRAIYALDPALAMRVAGFSWVQDGIYGTDIHVLRLLRQLVDVAPEEAGLVIGYPWLSDEITEHESWGMEHLLDIAERDEVLGANIAVAPWIADGISESDAQTIGIIFGMLEEQGFLVAQILGLPWVTDGLTEAELGQLQTLADAANEDPALAFNLLPEMLQSEGN